MKTDVSDKLRWSTDPKVKLGSKFMDSNKKHWSLKKEEIII